MSNRYAVKAKESQKYYTASSRGYWSENIYDSYLFDNKESAADYVRKYLGGGVVIVEIIMKQGKSISVDSVLAKQQINVLKSGIAHHTKIIENAQEAIKCKQEELARLEKEYASAK